MTEKLTDDEHTTRAMLLGMRYHHGNGRPFYYQVDEAGAIVVRSMIDTNTLEAIPDPVDHFMENVVLKAKTSARWTNADKREARKMILYGRGSMGAYLWLR